MPDELETTKLVAGRIRQMSVNPLLVDELDAAAEALEAAGKALADVNARLSAVALATAKRARIAAGAGSALVREQLEEHAVSAPGSASTGPGRART